MNEKIQSMRLQLYYTFFIKAVRIMTGEAAEHE